MLVLLHENHLCHPDDVCRVCSTLEAKSQCALSWRSCFTLISFRSIRPRMGSKRLDSLGDFLRHKYRLRIECRGCNRIVIKEPLALLELCRRRGWGHQLPVIERRLRCSRCGGRHARIGPAFGSSSNLDQGG